LTALIANILKNWENMQYKRMSRLSSERWPLAFLQVHVRG